MTNPYETPSAFADSLPSRRPVLRCFVAATLLFALVSLLAIPTAPLLNQYVQVVPTDTYISAVGIAGYIISDKLAIVLLLVIMGTLTLSALGLVYRGMQNIRWNALLRR